MDEPKLHMWETGVMRITRHPQSFGQALWCFAHTLWIGSSFMVATSGMSPCASGARACQCCRVRALLQYAARGCQCVKVCGVAGALMAHHLFSCWHGDFRLRRKYGEVSSAPLLIATATPEIKSACGMLAHVGVEPQDLTLDAHLGQKLAQSLSMQKHSLHG